EWLAISGRARTIRNGLDKQAEDLKFLTEEEFQKDGAANFIQAIGEKLVVRQAFLCSLLARCVDPWLLCPTALFLASKVEEFGVLSSKPNPMCQSIVVQASSLAARSGAMSLIFRSANFSCWRCLTALVVYHPYRSLALFIEDLQTQDSSFSQEVFPVAWKVINDSLRTDACLHYPPYLIALAGIHIACLVCGKDAQAWFAELSVDLDKVLEIVRLLLNLYELLKGFDERNQMPAIMEKMPRPKQDLTVPDNGDGQA
uniref:CYCLIN domain-containing protein n=1 Tax=Macrostomum lignano TaxID=282301 RepID=A0A1I8IA99_9PLAT